MLETTQVSGKSLAQSIRDVLRDAILDGRLHPDERIFEAEVAEQLGVSRTPLREALRLLEADGLVEYTPHTGVVVRAFSADEVSEIFELRCVLEGYAAGRAVDNLTRNQFLQLKKSCDEFEAVLRRTDDQRGRLYQLVELNREFHQIIAHAGGNQRLGDILSHMMTVPLVYTSFHWYSEEQRWRSLEYHRVILQALEDRDGDLAEKLVRQHLTEGGEFVIQHIEESFGNHCCLEVPPTVSVSPVSVLMDSDVENASGRRFGNVRQ